MKSGLKLKGIYEIECYGPDGVIKWRDETHNLVPDAGINHLLDVHFHGSTQIGTWYVGLTSSSPTPAAGDTMSSHAGWTEFVSYSQATRVAFAENAASSKSISNSGSAASFSINGSGTVGGAFLASDSTKSGTTGTLFSCAALTQGNKSVANGDTVNVTYTVTGADDGV